MCVLNFLGAAVFSVQTLESMLVLVHIQILTHRHTHTRTHDGGFTTDQTPLTISGLAAYKKKIWRWFIFVYNETWTKIGHNQWMNQLWKRDNSVLGFSETPREIQAVFKKTHWKLTGYWGPSLIHSTNNVNSHPLHDFSQLGGCC